MDPIGQLFPAGGRVEPDQMVGREGDRADLVLRLSEGLHTLVDGERRIGKTTVCNAACVELHGRHGFVVIDVEAPKQATATGFCQLVVDRCTRVDLDHLARAAARTARPTFEKILADMGVPLDLSSVGRELPPATRRGALELPLRLARQHGRRVVFFIDELQRVVDYGEGEGVIGDLVDLYAGRTEVVVLADGSSARVIERLLAEPFGIGKLVDRRPLAPTIPLDQWRRPLGDRFVRAGLAIDAGRLERLLAFGAGRPYETMTAARHIALTARRLGAAEIDDFCVEQGLGEAREQLDQDE